MSKVTKVKPIPAGFHTITPSLLIRDAKSALDFYHRAFGAERLDVMYFPDGEKVAHAQMKIGDSRIFLGEEMPEMGARGPRSLGGSAVQFVLYVQDVDAAFERAVKAGATVRMPVADQFWGDRFGSVTDPYGHEWALATHKEDVPPKELERRSQEFFKQMSTKRD